MPALRAKLSSLTNLVRVLGALLFVLALGAVVFFTTTVPRTDEAVAHRIKAAEFSFANGPWRAVSLPHTWPRDGLPNAGRARYRLHIDLPEAPTLPWALSASRLSSRHALRINGLWAHGAPLDRANAHRGTPVVTWVDLPPALLKAGRNEIELEVQLDLRAGQSDIVIGAAVVLLPRHGREHAWAYTVPLVLNLVCFGLALFLLSVWWQRREERVLGSFAGLLALTSIRNAAYTGAGTATHNVAADLFFYLAQVLSAALLAWFALRWSGRHWPRFRLAVNVLTPLLALGGLVAAFLDSVQTMRVLSYPLLLASLVPSLWLMVQGARSEPGGTRLAVLFGVVQLSLAPVHDYLYLIGRTSVMDAYWTPYATPVAMMIFAWAVLDRFVGALDAMESQAAVLERRVADRTAELASANAAKTRFLAAASHDLRQPVVSISLLSGLLKEQALTPLAQSLVQRIGDSVAALNSLLAGLLDLSRFEAGVVTPRHEAVALQPLLEAALADERIVAHGKNLALRVRATPATVLTDRLLLEQVVRNLVGNAVRYTDRGGVLVAARRAAPGMLRLQVWDTGRGIPQDRHEAVFEEFVQLQPEDSSGARGLGLGLSLVRRAAQLLGTPVRVRSRPGRGSCFEVLLLLAPGAAPATAATQAGRGVAGVLGGRRVWVVDDEPEVRMALRLRLQGWGAEVQAFAGWHDCVAALAGLTRQPDLVISDQRLGDRTGVDLIATLRERCSATLPALLVTGDTAPHDLRQLGASGLAILHKPFDGPALLQAVQGLLGHSTDGAPGG